MRTYERDRQDNIRRTQEMLVARHVWHRRRPDHGDSPETERRCLPYRPCNVSRQIRGETTRLAWPLRIKIEFVPPAWLRRAAWLQGRMPA